MIHTRRNHHAFGLGSFHDLGGSNSTVLSFSREYVDEDGHEDLILCVNNLSDKPQAATVQVPEHLGENELFDLFGGAGFPWIAADGRVTFTMGSRDFFWLRIGTESRG